MIYDDSKIFNGEMLTGETISMTNVPTGYSDKYMFLLVFAGLFLINIIFTIITIREYYVVNRNTKTKRSTRRNINSIILLIVLFINSFGLTQYTSYHGMGRIFAGKNSNDVWKGSTGAIVFYDWLMKTGYGNCTLENYDKVVCDSSITKFPFAKEFEYGEYRYLELHTTKQYEDYNLHDKCQSLNFVQKDITYSGSTYTHFCVLDNIKPNSSNQSFMNRFNVLEKTNELWFIPIVIYFVFLVGVALYNKLKKNQRLNKEYFKESDNKQHVTIEMGDMKTELQPLGDSKKTPVRSYKDYKDWKRNYSRIIKSIKKVDKKDFIELSPICKSKPIENKMFKKRPKPQEPKFYNPKMTQFREVKKAPNRFKPTPTIQSAIIPTYTQSTRVLRRYETSSSSEEEEQGLLNRFINNFFYF
ncbi:MAG: hypothetical protein CMF62_03470 [Magnetococcales bacterium]|nr:hypothetical protein [Magnetococcales bacterium]